MSDIIIIDSDCSGNFVIDSTGIRSKDPVSLSSVIWDDNKLILRGINPENDYLFDNSNKDSILINGSWYKKMAPHESGLKKMFSIYWSKVKNLTGNIQIDKLILNGVGHFDISLPLAHTATIIIGDNVTVSLAGHNDYVHLDIYASENASIIGNGRISVLEICARGSSKISGFSIHNRLKVDASYVSTVNLSHDLKCNVDVRKLSMSSVKLFKVPY